MVETIKKDKQPIDQARIRVFRRNDAQSVFIKEYQTNQSGKSERISLEALDSSYSMDIHSDIRPYGQYDMHISKDGYDTEIRNGVQIFADTDSTLQVVMQDNVGKTATHTQTIGEHQLHEGGGCRSC